MRNQNVLRILALVLTMVMMLSVASCDLFSAAPAETTPAETTKAPEVTTPEVTTPEVTTPEVTTPEVTTPEVTTPEVTTPEVTTPEVTTPEVTTPEVTTPEETTPEVTTPEVTTPEETTPEVTTPEVTTPEETTPEVTTPEETTPEETTPAEPVPGESEENPLYPEFVWNEEYTEASVTVNVAANSTLYIAGRFGGMLVSINGGEATYYEAAGFMAPPVVIALVNDSAEAKDYVINISYPAGTSSNPADLVIGENKAEISANTEGYYYTWTADKNGAITITIAGENWFYVVNNVTSGKYGDWLYFGEGSNTYTVGVCAGDEIQVQVNTYNPADMWNTPAGTITFTASFEECTTHDYGNRFEKKWGVCTICGYVDDNHEHVLSWGFCMYCDYEFEAIEVPSTFDNDGDGAADIFYFSAALPEEFTGEDVIWIDAFNDAVPGNHMEYDEIRAGSGSLPYPHVYCYDQSDDTMVYTINVDKAGYYNVAVHYRIKDQKVRGAKFVVNEGTENEQVINHTYGWETADDAYECRNNDFLIGSYMTGLVFALQEGENTITIRVADGVAKSQHFRDLYLVWSADLPSEEIPECEIHDFGNRFEKKWGICVVCGYVDDNHEHAIEAGKCVYCDYEFEAIEVPSTFDNDGNGAADIFYFSAALPEEFTGADVIWLDAYNGATGDHMDYDELRSGNYDPTALPYPHVYCYDQKVTDSIAFAINVEKAGLYNVAVHYRIKDQKVRGAKFIVNEGTANEQVINHTYGWATADDAYEVRNNDFLIGAYMTGLVFKLQAGENTITIRVADGVAKSQHFRDLYLVLAEEIVEECAHEWADATCQVPATCTKCGETQGTVAAHNASDETYACTVCGKSLLLTVEEAIALGQTYEKGKYGEEVYYVQATLNKQCNPNGFARTDLGGDLILSIAGGYLNPEGQLALYDTVVVKGNIGCVNSTTVSSGKESRVFNVTLVKIVEKHEHAYGEEITVVTPATCGQAGKGTVACVCGATKEVEIPVTGSHDFGNRFEKKWGVCVVCGYADDNHEHSIVEGKCAYCDYEFEAIAVPSTFDNDGDGAADVFYFSAALPEEFKGEDVIWIDAFNNAAPGNHMEYDEIRAGSGSLPYPHVYCYDQSDDTMVYTINVEKAGLYNVAVHYRIKDQKVRGAKFVVNEGTANEQSINHTYGWATADDAYECRNNDFLIGSYMTGLVFELQAGENTITIRVADGVAKSQHFRDLYLVPAGTPECETHDFGNRFEKKWGVCVVCGYVDDNHEHSIVEGVCEYCDYEFEAIEVPSTFDNDGNGAADMFYFSAALPEEFKGEDVIWIDAFNNAAPGNHMEYDEIRAGSGSLPYPHVYCYDQSDDTMVYTINVEKAGYYNVAVHYRIKDQKVRGAKFVVNEGTANEQAINHTYGWATADDAYECRNNDFLIGSYMTGLVFALQEGENTITIRVADGVAKSQHFRDLYLSWAAPFECETHDFGNRFEKKWGVCVVCGYADDNHEHVIVEGKCAYCDYEFEAIEVPSTFDNDANGAADIFYFSAALPEEFTGKDVIWIDAFNNAAPGNHMEYDEIRAGSGSLPYPHVYCYDQSDDTMVYTINVEKAGLYNVAVHYRIKDQKVRGAKFVVNEGTANEQSINHTYGWATADDAYECRNNDFLIGSYMTGLVFNLQAGENTITIRVADGVAKSQHFRDLYLIPVEA